MPLRSLKHGLLRPCVQTPSSPLSSVPSQSVQEPDYLDSVDKLQVWATSHVQALGAQDCMSPVTGAQTRAIQQTVPRFTRSEKSKVLVCHDFKGGYTEDPFERGYSFEFWHLIDTFIYFSHKRVTIPPRGWLDAGRRHGTRVLGTVIFEWAESKADLQECLYGENLHDVQITTSTSAVNLSTKYASHLITVAQARKFDGYLLNIETDLNFLPPVSSYPNKTRKEWDEDAVFLEQERTFGGLGGLISPEAHSRREQRMRKNVIALLDWVEWLRKEGKRRVGSHWSIIWYDSVTTAGRLEWQDALTPANAPFFMNADAIFTNYTWACPPDPSPPGALPDLTRPQTEHHPALLMSAEMAESLNRSKSDVYVGIDVFGRNCYGGFAVGMSLDMIFPISAQRHPRRPQKPPVPTDGGEMQKDLGLSVALFAPGWTWEREKEGGGVRTWNEWWEDELKFWVGCSMDNTTVGSEESFAPAVGTFFGPRERYVRSTSSIFATAISPSPGIGSGSTQPILPFEGQCPTFFYTNFNRGSGNAWWVRGRKVYDASLNAHDSTERRGWTDIGSCFPKPDRIWKHPMLLHSAGSKGRRGDPEVLKPLTNDMVLIKTSLVDYEAWEGGTSLEIQVRFPKDTGSFGLSRTFLPLCTLRVCHLASLDWCYALGVTVKRLSSEGRTIHDHHIRPCILWSDGESGKEELCHYAQVPSESVEIHELIDGWCSISVTGKLDNSTIHPVEVVPVVALELEWLSPSDHLDVSADIKFIVGEISMTALPPTSSTFHNVVESPSNPDKLLRHAAFGLTSSNILSWKPTPLPNGAPPGTLWGILDWGPPNGDTDIAIGYYNIFACQRSSEEIGSDVNDSEYTWLGTSTYEPDPNSFFVAGLGLSDIAAKKDPMSGEENGPQSAEIAKFSNDGDGSSTPQSIYFVVERVGPLGARGLTRESVRYTCKVEF